MTREDAQSLLTKLDEFEVRTAVVALRLPGDADVKRLRHDIAQRRAWIIDAVALLRQADAPETSPATLH